jgi:hypothetical protein
VVKRVGDREADFELPDEPEQEGALDPEGPGRM